MVPHESPSHAVIVPTFGRSAPVRRVLRDVLAQAPFDAEVVVVDQSAPAERNALRRWADEQDDPRLVLLARDPPGLPEARNAGVAATTAPIVLFLDDDVSLDPGCLAAHVAAYTDPTVGGVVGKIREERLASNAPSPTCRIGRDGRVHVGLDGDLPGDVDTTKGANMSFRRLALEQVGPFDPAFGGTALLEDADLSTRVARAGWRLVYVPEAAVTHHLHPTGGVRTGDVGETERWRFHNTGLFVARHRPAAAAFPVFATFGAIALTRAVRWRDPVAAPRLLSSLITGWVEGRRPPR